MNKALKRLTISSIVMLILGGVMFGVSIYAYNFRVTTGYSIPEDNVLVLLQFFGIMLIEWVPTIIGILLLGCGMYLIHQVEKKRRRR